MDEPLWTDRFAPALADLPQEDARDYLGNAVGEPLNLVVHGPRGVGKTAAVRALARESHADPDNDLVEINVADVFNRRKTDIKNDPRFASFLDGHSDLSKREMLKLVFREMAGYAPASGSYKTLVLDNAEAIREDFQQALRRLMERHHEATQFVIVTRQPTKLIPPIRSRCFPVPIRSPSESETASVLEDVADRADADYDEDGLRYVASWADGDLRKAILGAQTTHAEAGEITMDAAYEALSDVGPRSDVTAMLDAAEAGEFTDARSTLDDLLNDDGYSGDEVLDAILDAGRSRYDGERLARLHRRAGEADLDLASGTSDRLHLAHLLADLAD
ncbi:MAG: AAA family ATPase [Halobacteriaceae archaeon]